MTAVQTTLQFDSEEEKKKRNRRDNIGENQISLRYPKCVAFGSKKSKALRDNGFAYMKIGHNNYTGEIDIILSKKEDEEMKRMSESGKNSGGNLSYCDKKLLTFLYRELGLSPFYNYIVDTTENLSINPEHRVFRIIRGSEKAQVKEQN